MISIKNISLIAFIIIIAITLNSCKKDVVDGTLVNKRERYSVTFTIDWNATEYPTDYPGNAHFSKLIGWSHTANSTFFKVGTLASEGIEDMAELGKTNPLDDEIRNKIIDGEGLELVIGDNLSGTGVGSITVEVEVDELHPSVTLVTMLAPSPDWYLGVVNYNLFNDGEFVDFVVAPGLVYDAGTDDGPSYASPNDNTSPAQPISLLENSPLGNANTTNPIATVSFTRL